MDVKVLASMGVEDVQALIDRATRADVPLRVLFAALDRLTELTGLSGDEGSGAVANTCCGSAGAPRPVMLST